MLLTQHRAEFQAAALIPGMPGEAPGEGQGIIALPTETCAYPHNGCPSPRAFLLITPTWAYVLIHRVRHSLSSVARTPRGGRRFPGHRDGSPDR